MNLLLIILKSLLLTIYCVLEAIVLALVPDQWRRHKNIDGDIALVTGGGSGIGRLLALRLAEKGARIVLWDVNKRNNEETAKMIEKLGGRAYTYTVDVSQRADVYGAAAKVKDDVGTVTILVNNAGIVSGSLLLQTSDAKISKTVDVNLMAHFWTLKAFLPGMCVGNRGHVVTIASLAGYSGISMLADYCGSKHANIGLHESVALEMLEEKRTGVKFTLVCPYYISTGMFDGVDSLLPILTPEYVADEILSGILLNKDVLVLPKYMNIFVMLKGMLPFTAMTQLRKATFIDETMKTFVGRAGKTK